MDYLLIPPKLTPSAGVSTRVVLSFATGFLVLEFGRMLVSSLPAAVKALFYFISKVTKKNGIIYNLKHQRYKYQMVNM